MSHPRQAIREAATAALKGKTAAKQDVFATREAPWKHIELPGIAVYTLEESSERSSLQGGLKRTLSLAILAVDSLTERVDDALDELSLQIEQVLDADPTLGGRAARSVLKETKIGTDEDQSRPVGAARLTYEVTYYT